MTYIPKTRVVVGSIRSDLEGKLDDTIRLLQSYKDQYPDQELVLEIDEYYEYGELYIKAEICYYRDRTQEEINADKIRRLERERADFARFRKSLEDRGEKETAKKITEQILKINAQIRELGGSTA